MSQTRSNPNRQAAAVLEWELWFVVACMLRSEKKELIICEQELPSAFGYLITPAEFIGDSNKVITEAT